MKISNYVRLFGTLAIALGGATTASAQDSGVSDQMHAHYDAVVAMQRALVAGSLDATKASASQLLAVEAAASSDGWETYLGSMRSAAESVRDADDVVSAAAGVAAVGVACGDCHVANGVEITFDEVDRPSNKEKLENHMARHQWAADRMWEGLIGPSASAWSRGANLLFESPIKTDKLGDASEQDAIKQMSRRIHQLAANATTVSDASSKAGIYAEFLSNCAACHNAVGKGPQD
jgi:mono/diheme cytochrome c family protein